MFGPRARPVLSVIADRFRSIHMVLFDRKRNFSGPPLGGLAKNESKSDHFKWFDVCPDATHLVCPSSQYPVLKVHACAGSRLHRAARQGDILPDRRGPRGGNPALHILFTNEPWDPGKRQGLIGNHKSQTDYMSSVFLLSDVDVLVYSQNRIEQQLRDGLQRFPLIAPLHATGAPPESGGAPVACNLSRIT
jgi:hypothetical protein